MLGKMLPQPHFGKKKQTVGKQEISINVPTYLRMSVKEALRVENIHKIRGITIHGDHHQCFRHKID